MRPMAVLASVFALLVAAALVVWVGQGVGGNSPPKRPEVAVETSDLPTPATVGPHPKTIILETTFDFGVMLHGAKGRHEFVVKNEGKVPLVIKKESTSCQCTGAELNGESIAPGVTSFIEMSWEIKAKAPKFEHTAVLRTNDPDMPSIRLIVQGLVGLKTITLPEGAWSMGELNESDPGRTMGYIGTSEVEEFDITIESSPFLKAESKKLVGDELVEARKLMVTQTPSLGQEALSNKDILKSAYRISVTTAERGQQGSFSETLTIVTTIPGAEPISVIVSGVNPGAFQFFTVGDVRWNPKEQRIDLGDIDATKGKKATILMFARGLPEALKVSDVTISPSFLKAGVEPLGDGAPGSQMKLAIEFPAGSPAQSRTVADPAIITFKTNHPLASEMKLKVLFHGQ